MSPNKHQARKAHRYQARKAQRYRHARRDGTKLGKLNGTVTVGDDVLRSSAKTAPQASFGTKLGKLNGTNDTSHETEPITFTGTLAKSSHSFIWSAS